MKLLKGRLNRQSYWLAFVLLAVIAGIGGALDLRTFTLEIFLILAGVPRLHDIGRSGWWVVLPIAVSFFGGMLEAVRPAEDGEIIFAAYGALNLVFIAALGCIPGVKGPNRFGMPVKGVASKPVDVSETFS